MRTRALNLINTGGELVERSAVELKGWYVGLRHEWAEMCKEGGSMWEDLRSKWQRKRSEALRVALLALFAVAVKIVTGVGPMIPHRGVLSRGDADAAMRLCCVGVRGRVCSRVDTRAAGAVYSTYRSSSGCLWMGVLGW